MIEVTSPRLYVGNLSFDATESDLFDLFNGVGHVQNAEVVSYKHNQRSKGFAFVQMQTVEEAKRAVTELHDKEFLGRTDDWLSLLPPSDFDGDRVPRDVKSGAAAVLTSSAGSQPLKISAPRVVKRRSLLRSPSTCMGMSGCRSR